MVYVGAQTQAPAVQSPPATTSSAQYVVNKLHVLEAHRITSGDDVLVAVIDSKIDTKHPDLTGVVADEYDVVGSPAIAHSHGTAMAGGIATRSKLTGVAPKVKLLAVRAFRVLERVRKAPHSIFSRVSIGLRARTRASSI